MKRLLISTLSFIICTIVSAQWWSLPQMPPMRYAPQLPQIESIDYRNLGAAHAAILLGKYYMSSGNYKSALEQFEEAYEKYNYIPALEYIGTCYELGIGTTRDTQWADVLYQSGAAKNNQACKQAIRRIQLNDHWPASYKATYLKKFRAKFNAEYGTISNTPSDYSGTNHSNSSTGTYATCRICSGNGVCTSCHGKRGEYVDTGSYTGNNTKSWINCPSCRGNGKCYNCYGTGRQ